MNREDIICMAIEAGWDAHHAEFDTRFQIFVALIAFAEREACIKAIEDQIGWDMDDPESTAIKAIRARGQA